MTPTAEKINGAFSAARQSGFDVDYDQLRRHNGRSRAVRPGFNPWGRRPRLKPGDDINVAELAQIEVARELRAMRDRIKAGDKMKTLKAMFLVTNHGLVPPAWLADAFTAIMLRFYRHEVKGLDEAFDNPPLTERARKVANEREYLVPAVYRLAVGILRTTPDEPVDAIIDQVAGLLQIGSTKCREAYDYALTLPQFVPLPELRDVYKSWPSGEI
jgi:hypothetical protein